MKKALLDSMLMSSANAEHTVCDTLRS